MRRIPEGWNANALIGERSRRAPLRAYQSEATSGIYRITLEKILSAIDRSRPSALTERVGISPDISEARISHGRTSSGRLRITLGNPIDDFDA